MSPPASKNNLPTLEGHANPLAYAVNERDRSTVDMVRVALEHKQAMLAFQPIVVAQDPSRVAFYEGLIRIRDGTGRVIPAQNFIPVVENTDMGRRIDCLALELGLAELLVEPSIRLSINVSALSIGHRGWLAILDRGLASDTTIAERLILEITESSAITSPRAVMEFMTRFQERGVSFALDDFGAGFTSFRYLRDLFFDVLKIDGQFVKNIHKDLDNQVLLSALASIGKHFEMVTVAEAVETQQEAAFLQSIGIDCMQGFCYGAPTINPAWRSQTRKAGTG